jgi:hypothetical protein
MHEIDDPDYGIWSAGIVVGLVKDSRRVKSWRRGSSGAEGTTKGLPGVSGQTRGPR